MQSFGKAARVGWGEEETVFLGDYGGAWLVYAAGCRPAGERLPHDCDISGG